MDTRQLEALEKATGKVIIKAGPCVTFHHGTNGEHVCSYRVEDGEGKVSCSLRDNCTGRLPGETPPQASEVASAPTSKPIEFEYNGDVGHLKPTNDPEVKHADYNEVKSMYGSSGVTGVTQFPHD